nr:MAG TPA: Lysis protein [Caudoviricetes sp.]
MLSWTSRTKGTDMKKIIALGGVAGLALGALACCQPAYAAPTDPDANAQCEAAWPGLSQGASDDGECSLGGGTITTDADGNSSFTGHGSWQVSDGDTSATSTDGAGTFTGAPSTTYIVGFYGRSDVPGANACDTLTMTAVAVPSGEPSSPEALPRITPTVPDTTPGRGTVVPSTQGSEPDEPAASKADSATIGGATADESSDSESSSPEAVESSSPEAVESSSPEAVESSIPQATPSAEATESAAPAERRGLPRTGGNGTSFALGTLVGLVAATASLLALGYRVSKER